MGDCNCSMFCCTLLYVPSSFAIILIGKRELAAMLSLSSWCLVIVVWLAVPWVCLQLVIAAFPDHTHFFSDEPNFSLLFLENVLNILSLLFHSRMSLTR